MRLHVFSQIIIPSNGWIFTKEDEDVVMMNTRTRAVPQVRKWEVMWKELSQFKVGNQVKVWAVIEGDEGKGKGKWYKGKVHGVRGSRVQIEFSNRKGELEWVNTSDVSVLPL